MRSNARDAVLGVAIIVLCLVGVGLSGFLVVWQLMHSSAAFIVVVAISTPILLALGVLPFLRGLKATGDGRVTGSIVGPSEKLGPGEIVEHSLRVTYSRTFWRRHSGQLASTNRRLLFVPHWRGFFTGKASIPYGDVTDWRIGKSRRYVGAPISWAAPALTVTTTDKRKHTFWPVVFGSESDVTTKLEKLATNLPLTAKSDPG